MLDDVEENGYQCVCSSGYAPSATDPETNIVTGCSYIDECDAENPTHNCDSNSTCNKKAGGYTCSCNEGFRQTGDGHIGECSNIDELGRPTSRVGRELVPALTLGLH